MFMQLGLVFIAPGADTAAAESGGGGAEERPERAGIVFVLYHCELMPLFSEE